MAEAVWHALHQHVINISAVVWQYRCITMQCSGYAVPKRHFTSHLRTGPWNFSL